MSRLLNMADPDDRTTMERIQTERATEIRALMNDSESRAALEVLHRKGHKTSVVHGALSALKRSPPSNQDKRRGPVLQMNTEEMSGE
ncbi:MAG: hypothetical protein AAGB11_14070 [Pseudomonadota bacterium]